MKICRVGISERALVDEVVIITDNEKNLQNVRKKAKLTAESKKL